MNDRHDKRADTDAGTAERDTDLVEIARLLPAPAPWDLPHEQHLHHKEQLMQRIDHDQVASQPRPARRLLRPAFLVPVSALALGGILTAGIVVTTGDDAPATTATRQHTTSGTSSAAVLLDRISLAAGRGDALEVRDDQFVYTRSKSMGADLTSGKAVADPLRETESWVAQEPGPLLKMGITKTDGEKASNINAQLGDTEGTPAGLSRPTYNWLASLPTDPDKLLTYLYEKTPKFEDSKQERDQAVFEQIGSLVGGLMPPETAAALYQAAARIPGVSKAPDAHDAIGRKGVGISRDDKTFGTRTEWVFDKKDLNFLGSRSYLVRDTQYGKAGTLMSSDAVLATAVVDKAGRAPATAQQS
ncbi:CU044_5270 family protein [Streptomyces kunmingensis]|uniref:CU044_5270 family protein n=1 Tax=Streptomyces kunmingensis TaxID=68225 RepID=A0ABU6CP63_9ACTN|nr:CU044_5270 family protein [Streptomyces kunmingensis]MEB3965705.1 CU044_5270 family protein [Streptomyces kunmingensis]